MTNYQRAVAIAKQGFAQAMRFAQYESNIGLNHYRMDRDAWAMVVTLDNGHAYQIPVRKSWS